MRYLSIYLSVALQSIRVWVGISLLLRDRVYVMIRWFPSIEPSLMAASFTAVLEIENIFANTGDKTVELLGRGPSSSSWLTHFPTGG
jgi:hypothetical protein